MSMRLLVTGGSGFIGTNVIEHFKQRNIPLLNLDWNKPLDPAHNVFWRMCDIMDSATMRTLFTEFQPTHVVHLAARADTDEPNAAVAALPATSGRPSAVKGLELLKFTTAVP